MLSIPWSRLHATCRIAVAIAAFSAGMASRGEERPIIVTGLPEQALPGLEPILREAVKRAPEVLRHEIEISSAEGRRHIGNSVLLPSLTANARYATNNESTVSGASQATNDSSGFFYGVDLTQPVFAWGALKARAEQDRIGLKIAERQFAEAYASLAQLLRRGYLDLVARKAGLRSAEAQLKLDRDAIVREQAKLDAKRVAPGAVTMAKLTVEQRELDIDRAREEFDFAKRNFMRLAGLAELADDAIPSEIARPAPADPAGAALIQAFDRGGVEETPHAQALALDIKKNEQSYIIAKRRLYPKFALFAGYSVRSETQADVNRLNQVAVASRFYGLKLDWALFDGFATKGEKIVALAGKRNAERSLQTHLDESREMARHQLRQLAFATHALDLAERNFNAAEAGLSVAEDDFAHGRIAEADLAQARQARVRAAAAIVPTRADYLMRWAEFVSLVGADPVMAHLPSRYVR